ncbi:hypothetical protein F1880_005562 [Penicillium rolfsii]|nr:hypothetical protein F1880_005562 [Penicillium rolfsii]
MPNQERSKFPTIPAVGDADRKRVLNVLAQRRYRQRKREKLAALEQITRTAGPPRLSENPPTKTTAMNAYPSDVDAWHGNNVEPSGGRASLPSVVASAQSASLPTLTNGHSDQPYSENTKTDSKLVSDPYDFTSALADLEAAQFTFPDDQMLDVPVLDVLRAGSNLASILGCQDTIWDLTALRTLNSSLLSGLSLTSNLEPTVAQATIPHHPVFDILPWPSMRTKLITIFSLPVQSRPLIARDPLALMQLIYDLDDTAEGLRVSGFDWRSETNWEVGQKVFENWWFVLDPDIVQHSNRLRERRGVRKLLLPTGHKTS